MDLITRTQREQHKDSILQPIAVKNSAVNFREFPEAESTTRTRFERDRDRIIHSNAWRALAGKMQVYRSNYAATIRTRLTHTLEVESIARTIAARLSLNEDFAGCCAIKHDIAHPPFGHAGEHAVNEALGPIFEHNAHAYITVTRLEQRSPEYLGLNLCKETNEASLKHSTVHSTHLDPTIPVLTHNLPLEVQVADLADPIAYCTADFQDAASTGILHGDLRVQINQQPLLQLASKKENLEFHEEDNNSALRLSSALIKLLIADVCQQSKETIEAYGLQTLDDVYNRSDRTISFSPAIIAAVREFKAFMMQHVYMGEVVKAQSDKGKRVVQFLCEHLLSNTTQEVEVLQNRFGYERKFAVRDYVCALTDNEAEARATELGFIG